MKNKLLIFLIAVTPITLFSQSIAEKSENKVVPIAITVVDRTQTEEFSSIGKNALHNKINAALLKGGFASMNNSRFILVPNLVLQSKDITPTAPPKHAYTVDINLYIGDGLEGTMFSHTNFVVKGVGNSEAKAYLDALKNINQNDIRFQTFIAEGKARIVQYYNTKCDAIITEAKALAYRNNIEEAFYKLSTIPDVCVDCFKKANQTMSEIYKQKIDLECKELLLNAQSKWQADLSYSGAENAAYYLKQINPNASCYPEAVNLNNSISNRLLEIDRRNWDLKLKQQINTI